MLECCEMLHRSLRTVAPRVEIWLSKRQGEQLPHCRTFTVGDEKFCRQHGLTVADFQAFKDAWLAGEGAQVCRYERRGHRNAAACPSSQA